MIRNVLRDFIIPVSYNDTKIQTYQSVIKKPIKKFKLCLTVNPININVTLFIHALTIFFLLFVV